MKRLNEWLEQWEKDIASSVKKHNGDILHGLALSELAGRLQKIREAVNNDDTEKAVLWTAEFTNKAHEWENLFQKPKLFKEARSSSARNAVNSKDKVPLPTVEALKKDFAERMENSGPETKETTVYKDMAEACIGRREYWRRIRTQVTK